MVEPIQEGKDPSALGAWVNGVDEVGIVAEREGESDEEGGEVGRGF